jgi:hypothetical protein
LLTHSLTAIHPPTHPLESQPRFDGQQVFNPSWIEASPDGTVKAGLIIRTQNCTVGYNNGGCGLEDPTTHTHSCCGCNMHTPTDSLQKRSVLTFSPLVGSDGAGTAKPKFQPVTADSVVFAPVDEPPLNDDYRGTGACLRIGCPPPPRTHTHTHTHTQTNTHTQTHTNTHTQTHTNTHTHTHLLARPATSAGTHARLRVVGVRPHQPHSCLPVRYFLPFSYEHLASEDPRVALDKKTGTYYMFYTCYHKVAEYSLCLASTKNPTVKTGWTRHGTVFPGGHKVRFCRRP